MMEYFEWLLEADKGHILYLYFHDPFNIVNLNRWEGRSIKLPSNIQLKTIFEGAAGIKAGITLLLDKF